MANDDFEKLPVTGKEPGYHKVVKTTSETSKTTHEEHESRGGAWGRYEKRLVTSETREKKSSFSEIRQPSALTLELPAAWRASLPEKMRIRIRGVQPAGCADAEEFDGEYILDLLETRAEQCRWELTLSPKCHLYRICLVAVPTDGKSVELQAFFEGSEAAPGWKQTIDSTPFARVMLEFDDSRATNPIAGCVWPRTIEIEPIGAAPPGRFKIPAAPTPAELAKMAIASSSGCTSSGPAGYSILGPRHVPGLSEYTYQLDAPAGVNITNIVWTVNKATASIAGPDDELQVSVLFKNTTPDYIRLRASFDADGKPESVQICVALVQVIVEPPNFTNPGTAVGSTGVFSQFLSTVEPPTCVISYDPGSTCGAFNCAPAMADGYESAVKVTSGSAAAFGFQAVTRVTLVAPTQAPTALQHISVGWIQNAYRSGQSTYDTTPVGGYRRIYRATIQGLDWLGAICSPTDKDLWPWYSNLPNSWATGSGSGTWQKVLGMNDSPSLVIPLFYNQTDPNDPNQLALLQECAVTHQFTLRMAARTKDSDLDASDHYFSIGRAHWKVDYAWPVVSESIVELPLGWANDLQPGNEINVDYVPAVTASYAPYTRWLPQLP
ncbi:MAG TPA: hypothetical protein VMV10_27300 [Pirellulales bacterium]|nr:hypothetical protein [Pirellulales bacterium]